MSYARFTLYNTLSRGEEELTPVEPGFIKMYVCGPTVYDYTHIGHGRTYVVYDSLKRYLSLMGYNVIHVVNITDIDDKIIRRARDENRDWREIVDEYTRDYMESLGKLGVTVDHHPRVTSHIGEIIEFIQSLIDKGYAYVTEKGNVYFEVDQYQDYGRLSGRTEREQWSQEQEYLAEKKKPYDFALWKAAKPGEPYWDSPWGKGRPGWHIECSVMSSRYLGSRFDIHGGGSDLIFPHHENERAQSESLYGGRWVSIWMHTGLVMVGADKMSKSLGNIIPLREALSKWNPGVLRLWYLHVHYRKPLYFTEENIEQVSRLHSRIQSAYELLLKLRSESTGLHYLGDSDLGLLKKLVEIDQELHRALRSDFNTPRALGAVSELVTLIYRDIQYNPKHMFISLSMRTLRVVNYVFGLFEEKTPSPDDQFVNQLIEILVNTRKELRKRGLYDIADGIRNELSKIGIQLMDKGIETTWIRRKQVQA